MGLEPLFPVLARCQTPENPRPILSPAFPELRDDQLGTDGWTGRCHHGGEPSHPPFLMERAAGASQSIPLPQIPGVLELELSVVCTWYHMEGTRTLKDKQSRIFLSFHMALGMVSRRLLPVFLGFGVI